MCKKQHKLWKSGRYWASYLNEALYLPWSLQGSWLVTTLSLCRGFQKTTPTMVTWKFHKKPKKATLKVVVEKQVTMTKNKWRKCQKTATIILYPSTQLHRMNCPKKKLQGSHFSPNTFGWNICGVIFYWARFSIQNLKNPKAKSSYF